MIAAIAETADRVAGLRASVEAVAELASTPVAEPEGRGRWFADLEDAVLGLSETLPEGREDYDARKLLEFLVGLRRAIEADPDGADPRGDVALGAMAVGDVAHRISRRLEHDALDDPRAAAGAVFAALPGAGAVELGRLLGVSTKTIGAWRAGRPVTRNAARVVLVAQLLTYLRPTLTPAGLMMWFDAPRAQLGGRTALEVLSDGPAAAREPLSALARGSRGQLAD